MEKNTDNLNMIKEIAINLLEIPVTEKNSDRLGFVYHPFISSTIVPYNNEFIEIFKEKNKFNEYIEDFKKCIKEETNVYKLILLLNKPYRLFFLSLIQEELDEETFANLLKKCYTETEFPNHDANVSVEELRDMFEKCNKDFLMENDEKATLESLADEITIYRGFYSNKYYNALSWTFEKKTACFFAKRFSEKGSIYQATIKKEDIYAYFNCRNEQEIIVDYDKLYNITKKEQFK